MKRKLVISSYNASLDWVERTHAHGYGPENTIIYNKGDDGKDWSNLGQVIKHPNIGANQYDILTFIIDNYDDLPDVTVFFKGNTFTPEEGNYGVNKGKPPTYYTTDERFIETLKSETYFSAWYNPDRFRDCKPHSPDDMLNEGLMQQPLNYCDFAQNRDLEHRYFSHPYQVLEWCFESFPGGDLIKFLPASNMALPKENILRYSKGRYEKLKYIINYVPDPSYNSDVPAECYLLERIFYLIWSNNLKEI